MKKNKIDAILEAAHSAGAGVTVIEITPHEDEDGVVTSTQRTISGKPDHNDYHMIAKKNALKQIACSWSEAEIDSEPPSSEQMMAFAWLVANNQHVAQSFNMMVGDASLCALASMYEFRATQTDLPTEPSVEDSIEDDYEDDCA